MRSGIVVLQFGPFLAIGKCVYTHTVMGQTKIEILAEDRPSIVLPLLEEELGCSTQAFPNCV